VQQGSTASGSGDSRRSGPLSEQLRQSEERFRLLVEAVEDYAIFMLDPAGLIVSWNSGAERIKGYAASEVIGRHFRMFYPEDKQIGGHPEYELVQALAVGHFEEEGWRVRKDGTLMWANVLITPVYGDDGAHLGFAKVTRDISERRKHQDEREAAERNLAALNVELGRANEILTATAEQRADFLAVTAHELRTPISVISGSASALSTYWEDLGKEERDDLLGAISTSAARLTRLLNDLLTAAKLESGSMDLRLGPVRLSEVLEEAVTNARLNHGGEGPQLDASSELTVRGDRDRLAQAVDNLVQNAFRHGRPPVRIMLRDNQGVAEIRVSDAGDGVPTGARTRLFERYVTGGRKQGTGLGLFIARELARAHGGDAWWDAPADADAAFVIGIPLGGGEL
jgi:PAS domain S-box-containing protein